MINDIKRNVADLKDEEEMRNYLGKIVDKNAFDKKGLIYGMGHAVYSLSDPRAEVFKSYVKKLALEKHRDDDFAPVSYTHLYFLGTEFLGNFNTKLGWRVQKLSLIHIFLQA